MHTRRCALPVVVAWLFLLPTTAGAQEPRKGKGAGEVEVQATTLRNFKILKAKEAAYIGEVKEKVDRMAVADPQKAERLQTTQKAIEKIREEDLDLKLRIAIVHAERKQAARQAQQARTPEERARAEEQQRKKKEELIRNLQGERKVEGIRATLESGLELPSSAIGVPVAASSDTRPPALSSPGRFLNLKDENEELEKVKRIHEALQRLRSGDIGGDIAPGTPVGTPSEQRMEVINGLYDGGVGTRSKGASAEEQLLHQERAQIAEEDGQLIQEYGTLQSEVADYEAQVRRHNGDPNRTDAEKMRLDDWKTRLDGKGRNYEGRVSSLKQKADDFSRRARAHNRRMGYE